MLARGLNFGLSLHLHPCHVYASSESSGESAYMRRLASAFVSACYDKYQHFGHWPVYFVELNKLI